MAVIACKLPTGLQVDHNDVRVVLKGANDPGAVCGFGMTEVDDAFAEGWFTKGPGKDMQIAKVGGLFIAKGVRDAVPMAKERKKEKSGFEGLDPNKPAPGIEPTDDTKKELAKTPPVDPDA